MKEGKFFRVCTRSPHEIIHILDCIDCPYLKNVHGSLHFPRYSLDGAFIIGYNLAEHMLMYELSRTNLTTEQYNIIRAAHANTFCEFNNTIPDQYDSEKHNFFYRTWEFWQRPVLERDLKWLENFNTLSKGNSTPNTEKRKPVED